MEPNQLCQLFFPIQLHSTTFPSFPHLYLLLSLPQHILLNFQRNRAMGILYLKDTCKLGINIAEQTQAYFKAVFCCKYWHHQDTAIINVVLVQFSGATAGRRDAMWPNQLRSVVSWLTEQKYTKHQEQMGLSRKYKYVLLRCSKLSDGVPQVSVRFTWGACQAVSLH